MKTNKEFGDYVFEKAEKYKAKRAATIKRIASGIAGCLAFAVVVTLMGINGIFNVGNLNDEIIKQIFIEDENWDIEKGEKYVK